jgi:RNA polymerase sigma-70 factor, ECF subfamily
MAFAALFMNAKQPNTREAEHYSSLLAAVAERRDRQAFAELFDHFAPRIKNFMMRKGASSEVAEDLVQETMISMWSKANLYVRERGTVAAWVFTIARNLRIDRLRREQNTHLVDMEDFDAPADIEAADDVLYRFQADGHVAAALEKIPQEQRELLIMSYVDDIPQSEIATRLNIPLGTVKSRMRLGYRRLRKLLETVS